MTPQKPNILFIYTDQHRYDCVGANGHAVVQTPALDRLAREGMSFTRAFTPSPVCVPARNTLAFGVWPAVHGVIANPGTEAPWPTRRGLVSYTSLLREAGYHLAHVGKWQVDPEAGPRDFGFAEDAPASAYSAWRAEAGISPKPRENSWFGEEDPHVVPEQSSLGWGAAQVIDMVERATVSDKPFFIQWETSEPHLPNVVPQPYCSLYDSRALTPWPGFADDLQGKPYIQAQQRRTWGLEGWTWDDWSPVVARYLGEVSLLDSQIGRILECLDRLQLTRNTLVVYSCDHGDMCGSHGMIDKHYVMYDDVVRVPMFARWPGHIDAGAVCTDFVINALDLPPTFLEAAGADRPDEYQGHSLVPVFDEGGVPWRGDTFATYFGNQFGLYSQRMVRGKAWKYVWNATAEDELYDLVADPGEIQNRARDPRCATELQRLRVRLVEWMEQTGDPLLNQWTRDQLLRGLSV